ncbi:MAG TPA: metallophosphoesterase [Jiangellaceae bacterium]
MPLSPLSRIALGTGLLAAGGLAYAAGYEVRSYRLRKFDVPVLPAGSRPLKILHISDLHQTPGQLSKREWVRALDSLEPDLVVNTGDNLAHADAVPYALDALGPLLRRPGVFVFGGNDYYGPVLKNPARYLLPPRDDRRLHAPDLPWKELRDGLLETGWLDLNNARQELIVDGRRIAFVGVDDAHTERDDYPSVSGAADRDADIAIGVMHAPYLRVLDAMHADGFPLLIAGHTHGGQLCVPGWGALVTNCDLEPQRAKGLSRHPAGDASGAWLHVSAGLGTSPYAPVRFACPPEATLLTLTAAQP